MIAFKAVIPSAHKQPDGSYLARLTEHDCVATKSGIHTLATRLYADQGGFSSRYRAVKWANAVAEPLNRFRLQDLEPYDAF